LFVGLGQTFLRLMFTFANDLIPSIDDIPGVIHLPGQGHAQLIYEVDELLAGNDNAAAKRELPGIGGNLFQPVDEV